MKFSAVILAGGKSSRMGRDKAGLRLEGRTLLERQAELVRSLQPVELWLSGGSNDYPLADGQPVRDNFANCGPLAGVEAGLGATNASLLLVLAVDLPQMSAGTLKWLLRHCGELTGAIPRINGEIEPLVAVYPKAAHPHLREALTAQRNAAHEFARACVAHGLAGWADVPGEHQRSFANCNSPQEWKALTKHA